jgi:hypothetical protein
MKRQIYLFLAMIGLLSIMLVTPSPAAADNVTFVGATGPIVGDVYTAPYQLQVSTILGGATINTICDDFGNEVLSGETWTAQVETFSASGVLSPGAMFAGFANSTTLYDEAAYLYSNFLNGSADVAGTNYAIWGLFDSSVTSTSAYSSTDAASLLSMITSSDLAGFNYSPYEVITPVGNGSIGTLPQEYIYANAVSTPEPGTLPLALSGIGLLGLCFTYKRSQALA